MKIIEVRNFSELHQKIKDSVVPVKVAYKFSRFFSALAKEEAFLTETLNGIINKYGKRDENNQFVFSENKQSILIKEDQQDECMKKIKELNDLEVELEYTPQFTFEELDGLNLSIEEINLLMPFIKEE